MREKQVISKRNIAKASIRGDLNVKGKDDGNDGGKDDVLGKALNSRGSMSPGDFKKNVAKRRDSQNFKGSQFKDDAENYGVTRESVATFKKTYDDLAGINLDSQSSQALETTFHGFLQFAVDNPDDARDVIEAAVSIASTSPKGSLPKAAVILQRLENATSIMSLAADVRKNCRNANPTLSATPGDTLT